MTTVVPGGFGGPTTDGQENNGTEFLSTLPPPGAALRAYDPTKTHDKQPSSVPQIFRDAMSVREQVFGEQGVPLEAEFDEDDERSWHWVVYASVAVNSPSPDKRETQNVDSIMDDRRRASATATRLPVGTIRLVPPPHGPNKYLPGDDKHPDADPPAPASDGVDGVDITPKKHHPTEPYIKLGRLAVLAPYRSLGLSKLLINTVLDYASKHPEYIRPLPPPTALEQVKQLGNGAENGVIWSGLAMVHAQVSVAPLWQKFGFDEELVDASGNVEISKEDHWIEEGIEHVGLWRRLKLDGRL